jgi:UDP-N-acetylglucosamine transferase subunit ALG13
MIFVVVSTGHFDPLISACAALSNRYDFLAQIGIYATAPPFPHFRTAEPAEIERHMKESEMVVTHAGCGMLSMLYRLRKKSVVIPKQERYGEANDSQVELGRKWASLHMSVLCMDVGDLEKSILACRSLAANFPSYPALVAYLRTLIAPAVGAEGEIRISER